MQLKVALPPLAGAEEYHVYCSIYNEGALTLAYDALRVCGQARSTARVCTDASKIAKCRRFLLYLNGCTWSSRALSSTKLTEELELAMRSGVQLCLAHEVPMFAFPGSTWDHAKSMGGIEQPTASIIRHACDFEIFFAETPLRLLQKNIYNTIASPLKGGEWRAPSLKMLAMQLYGNMDAPKEQRSGSLLWRERGVVHNMEKGTSWMQSSWKQVSLRRQSRQSSQQQSPSKLSSPRHGPLHPVLPSSRDHRRVRAASEQYTGAPHSRAAEGAHSRWSSKFQSTPRVLPSTFASTAKDSNTSAVDFSTVPTKLPPEGDPSPVGSSPWTQPSISSTLAPQLLGGAGTLSPYSRTQVRKVVMGERATAPRKVIQYATQSALTPQP